MKRSLSIIAVSLALVSCASKGESTVPELAPAEVLSRAAKATQSLESAQYVAQGDFDSTTDAQSTQGTFRMDGMLQKAGEQLRFQLDLDAEMDALDESSTVSGTVEVVMISSDEVYMNLHSLASQPSSAIFDPSMVSVIAGKWWKLPETDTAPVTGTVTPDPRLLHAQAQVVEVTKDRGVDIVNGVPTYHYDVRLNKEKLVSYLAAVAQEKGAEFAPELVREDLKNLEASGQLWIDAEHFYIQKIVWVLQSLTLKNGGSASASVTITFRNHNSAPNIIPPTEYEIFSPAVFFALPPDALFPEEYGETDDMSDDDIRNILQQINSF